MEALLSSTSTEPASLRQVYKRYGGLAALENVDLSLQPGRVLALLGPNGAGKSTAVSLLLGLQPVDAGQVLLFGQPPHHLQARRQVGVMLQNSALAETLRVGELLTQTRGYYADPLSVADCVAIAGLEGLLSRQYGKLSGGQQRRVQFALAICARPKVLFLDEPTTGMDIQARHQLWAAIRERAVAGCAILLTTHYLEEAEALADEVAVLQAGRIVARGSVAQIRASVSRRCIRVRTGLDVEVIAQWPGVCSTRRDGTAIEIYAEPAELIVARLLQADPHLQELEVRCAGLTDAFLAITRTAEAA